VELADLRDCWHQRHCLVGATVPALSQSKHLILSVRWDRMLAVRMMLTLCDREEISRGLAEGLEFQEIALRIGRDPSVISREPPISLRVTPRGRENGVGLPADTDVNLGF
jgi:hypothetical protein